MNTAVPQWWWQKTVRLRDVPRRFCGHVVAMNQMRKETYRAIQVNAPGKFEMVDRAVTPPPLGKVRIRVEACSVWLTDEQKVSGAAEQSVSWIGHGTCW